MGYTAEKDLRSLELMCSLSEDRFADCRIVALNTVIRNTVVPHLGELLLCCVTYLTKLTGS
jgi:hypothetical protein